LLSARSRQCRIAWIPRRIAAKYSYGRIECVVAIEVVLYSEYFVHFLRGPGIKYNWRLMEKVTIALDARKAKFYGDLLADGAGNLE